jgi:hypothetical protein
MTRHRLPGLPALVGFVAACAHGPAVPPVDPCLGLTHSSKAPRRDYAEPEWVVGVGHSTGAFTHEQADQSARAAAAAAVASQLLVRIRSDFTSDESESSAGGGAYEARQKLRSTVDADLPGLVQVATCFDPESLRTTALAAWHRGRGARAMERLLAQSESDAAQGSTRLRGLLADGRILAALDELPALSALQRRLESQRAMATALGASPSGDTAAGGLATLLADVDDQRRLAVVRTGRASEASFAPLGAEAARVATSLGWKVVAEGQSLARLELSVESCQQQSVRAIGAVRASCPVSLALSEGRTGMTSASEQVRLEGAAATTELAVAVAVKQGLIAFEAAAKSLLSPAEDADGE